MLKYILGIILISMNMRMALTSIGPLIPDIRTDLDFSNTIAGLLTTLPLIIFAIVSPIASKISDRFGLERTFLGSFIILFVSISIRSIPHIATLLTGMVGIGIAIALFNVLIPGYVKQISPEKAGMMTGVYTTSMCLFAAIASGVSLPISNQIGWAKSLLIWALPAILATVYFWPSRKIRPANTNSATVSFNDLLKSKLLWYLSIYFGLQSLSFYVFIAWLPSMLTDKGFDGVQAGWLLFLMQFVSMSGTFLIPTLADRLKNQNFIVCGVGLIYIVGYLGLGFGANWLAIFSICIIGFCQGATISLALAFIALRANTTQEATILSGASQSFGYILAAIGPILFGYFRDQTGTWTLCIWILVVLNIFMTYAGVKSSRGKLFQE